MTILQTYLKGWGLAWKHLKLWGLLYIINFLFAFLVSFPIFQFLEAKLSHSLSLDKMYEQFDFTVYNDIMNEYGDVVGFLANQGILISVLYLLVSIFLVGGILNMFRHQKESIRFVPFWTGGATFYGRIFGLTLLFLFLHGLVAYLFFLLFRMLTAGGLDHFHSEAAIYKRAIIVFPFYLITATIIWMIQDYAKVILVADNSSLWKSLKNSLQFISNCFLSTFLLYALNLLVFSLLLFFYWRTPTSNATSLGLFIGQAFILFRIGTKLVNLGTATLWYDDKSTL